MTHPDNLNAVKQVFAQTMQRIVENHLADGFSLQGDELVVTKFLCAAYVLNTTDVEEIRQLTGLDSSHVVSLALSAHDFGIFEGSEFRGDYENLKTAPVAFALDVAALKGQFDRTFTMASPSPDGDSE